MLRAVIYCRCSTEEERQKEALRKQITEARESVRANGWMLVDEYIESKSGTTAENRKEYQRLFEDLGGDGFEIVQIKSQDRLMRNTKDWYLFIDRLVANGKKLYMYMEHKFYTPDDALITGIKAILAEEYSKELSKKINNAHRNRQHKGESFILPPGTYGYQRMPDKSILIVEEEAEIIRLMFHLCQTMGCGRIASVLEKEGYCGREGNFFSEEAIRRIIRNPIRCGTVVQNKRHFDFQLKQERKMPREKWIVHKDAIPAIVSEEVWKRANEAMDKRASKYRAGECHPGRSKGKYDLSGKIRCGLCKGTYYRTYRRGCGEHTGTIEWKCQNYLRYGRSDSRKARPDMRKAPKIAGKGCDNIHLKEQKLLEFLESICGAYYQNWGIDCPNVAEKALFILQNTIDKKETDKKSRELNQAIEKQKILSQKLLNKLLNEVITDDDYKQKKREIDEKLQNLQTELKVFQSSENVEVKTEDRLREIREKLKTDIFSRAILSEMLEDIEAIEVFEDRLKIRFQAGRLKEEVLEIPVDTEFVFASKKEAERERIITYMRENPQITAKEIAEIEQISLTTVNYRIRRLRQQGKIYFTGRGGHKGGWAICEGEGEE